MEAQYSPRHTSYQALVDVAVHHHGHIFSEFDNFPNPLFLFLNFVLWHYFVGWCKAVLVIHASSTQQCIKVVLEINE
jgi:hypothetical protein